MLMDVEVNAGADLIVSQNEAPRAGNVLQTQVGALEYAPDFGVDLRFFLDSEFNIQPASFQAYCVQRLLQHRINVVNVITVIQNLFSESTFQIGSSESNGGLVG